MLSKSHKVRRSFALVQRQLLINLNAARTNLHISNVLLLPPKNKKNTTRRYLQLSDGRLSGVKTWFSPPCRNAYLSCELFLGRADLSQLHEIYMNKHLSPLTSLVTS